MSGQNLFAAVLMASLIGASFIGAATEAEAAKTRKSSAKASGGAQSYVLESRRRSRHTRIHLPLGPAYIYYDYPYYYSRGHYPTHIGGYVYYPSYGRRSYGSYGR